MQWEGEDAMRHQLECCSANADDHWTFTSEFALSIITASTIAEQFSVAHARSAIDPDPIHWNG